MLPDYTTKIIEHVCHLSLRFSYLLISKKTRSPYISKCSYVNAKGKMRNVQIRSQEELLGTGCILLRWWYRWA
jgi:hypothetical protein